MEVRPICNAHTSGSTRSFSQQPAVVVLEEGFGFVYCKWGVVGSAFGGQSALAAWYFRLCFAV